MEPVRTNEKYNVHVIRKVITCFSKGICESLIFLSLLKLEKKCVIVSDSDDGKEFTRKPLRRAEKNQLRNT